MYALILAKTLCFKNRTLQLLKKRKECFIYLVLLFFPLVIYSTSKEIFLELTNHPRFDLIILSKITSTLLLALNSIVIIASIIASIGNLFTAKDLNLLLTLPISKRQIFCSKFISVLLESSWTIFLFLLPIFYSFASVLNLPFDFYLVATASVLILTSCSCSIGIIISCFAVNKIGAKACLEFIVALMSIALVYMMVFSNSPSVGADQNSIQEIISYFSANNADFISPHLLASNSIVAYWDSKLSSKSLLFLTLIATICFSLATIVYGKTSIKSNKASIKKVRSLTKIYRPLLRSRRYFIRGTLAAFMSKENKTILRDLSQASQFLILVFVTFVYLLNFQQLKNKPNLDHTSIELWYSLLAISNISLGSCVLTAIATRFVFPSISMEGKCFDLLKSAPLRMYDIVFYKFTTWLIPFSVVALIILTAGAFAIDANYPTLAFTAFIALNLSFALVATAIGTGAKYARFDWDSPTQVATGFGSVVLMFKSLFVVTVYIILAAVPISIFCIGDASSNKNLITCLLISTLTIFISTIFVRDNLKLGSEALQQQG